MLQFATVCTFEAEDGFLLGFPQSSPGCFISLACGLLLFLLRRKFMIPPRSKGFPVGRSLSPVVGVDESFRAFFGGIIFHGVFFSSQKNGDHPRRFHGAFCSKICEPCFFFVTLKRGKI